MHVISHFHFRFIQVGVEIHLSGSVVRNTYAKIGDLCMEDFNHKFLISDHMMIKKHISFTPLSGQKCSARPQSIPADQVNIKFIFKNYIHKHFLHYIRVFLNCASSSTVSNKLSNQLSVKAVFHLFTMLIFRLSQEPPDVLEVR
jgi:sensor histidine kinase YesM